ncbi:GLPGLI family protein [Flavobacterium sp.]
MIKNKITLIFIFFNLSFFSFSQVGNITVKYNYSLDDTKDIYGGNDFKKTTLVTNGKESLYSERNIDTTIVYANGEDITYINKNFVYYYSKNLTKKTITYKDRYVGMDFLIKDNNYSVKWTLTNNSKKIMGYTCQEAIGEFSCKSYKAYFFKDIPFSDGPFKFDGLPGLILEVLSDDGTVKITANEIILDNDFITNPYKDDIKFISYEEARKKYQLKFAKFANLTTDENGSVTIPKRYIECYVN